MNNQWNQKLEFYEYTKKANPKMPPIQYHAFLSKEHDINKTRLKWLDLSAELQTGFRATTPNVLIGFVCLQAGQSLITTINASSHFFYVAKGSGITKSEFGDCVWQAGDIITFPAARELSHQAQEKSLLYYVNDEPLLSYLGVAPAQAIFSPTHYPNTAIMEHLHEVRHQAGAGKRNRNGVLIANPVCHLTHTITPTLWALYNVITPDQVQPPHRHNSVALDFVISAQQGVYSLMSDTIDENGQLVNPIRADWHTNGEFITPPGLWHSHHNESDEDAYILPVQDAGLQTQMRTLDIRFARPVSTNNLSMT